MSTFHLTTAVTPWQRRLTRRLIAIAIFPAGLSLSISVAQESCVQPQTVTDAKFMPGQVWSYQTRPGERNSTITILRVEKTPKLGIIVHIRIDGIHLSNCTGGPSPETVQHAPFARAALDSSVIAKVSSTAKVPDYASGYAEWLHHCGGAYTIPVDRVIAIDDATFRAGLGCH